MRESRVLPVMARDHGPQIKDDAQYEALRRKGYSKGKSAAIANAPEAEEHGGHASKYEERSKQDLYEQAKRLDIEGRSKMSKSELIAVLRKGQ